MIRKTKAFTLAEVLITLVVIGVIAGFTIPSLLQNLRDAWLKTAWKEFYSATNQASQRVLMDNGGSFINVFTYSVDLMDAFVNNMSVVKICTNSTSYGNCFPAVGQIKYLDGTVLDSTQVAGTLGSTTPSILLNNGTAIMTSLSNSGCPVNADGRKYCGWMSVDVNGLNPPNTIGKDIFRIWVLDNRLIPQGAQGYIQMNDCSTEGWGCSSLYLMQ